MKIEGGSPIDMEKYAERKSFETVHRAWGKTRSGKALGLPPASKSSTKRKIGDDDSLPNLKGTGQTFVPSFSNSGSVITDSVRLGAIAYMMAKMARLPGGAEGLAVLNPIKLGSSNMSHTMQVNYFLFLPFAHSPLCFDINFLVLATGDSCVRGSFPILRGSCCFS